MTEMETYMAQPFLNDASSLVSLLIENSNGTFEVILRRIEFDGRAGFAPVQLIPLTAERLLHPRAQTNCRRISFGLPL